MAAAETTTKNGTQEQTAQPAQSRGEVAVIAPARLPYHPSIEQRFGIDRAGWRALVDAVYPAARSPESVILALSYCKARKLDPFKRPVHIVPIWSNEKRGYVETIWPGIGELRTTAFRTGLYAGCDETKFGPDEKAQFTGRVKVRKDEYKDETATVVFPAWAQITVHRMVGGQRVPFPGPRLYFRATYGRKQGTELPNDRWQTSPSYMLEKCAEAAALRKAFPEETGEMPTDIEADSRVIDLTADERAPAQPAPTRSQFQAEPVDVDPPHDPETGEIVDEPLPALAVVGATGKHMSEHDDPVDYAKALRDMASKVFDANALAQIEDYNAPQWSRPDFPRDLAEALRDDFKLYAENLQAAAQQKILGKAKKAEQGELPR